MSPSPAESSSALLAEQALEALGKHGAHHIAGILYQGLNDVGFSLAASAVTFWNDAAMGEKRDDKDLPATPDAVASTTATVAANAAHLARLLNSSPYPPA